MKRLIAGVVFLALTPALVAQAPEAARAPNPRAQGYTLFGIASPVGDAGNVMTLGGGGEAFVYKGLAVGGDMNYLFTGGRFTYGLGLASANPSYHFRGLDPDGQWVPFVTGGYTLAIRDGTANMGNYGGGVTYWVRPHWGARVEVRALQYAS